MNKLVYHIPQKLPHDLLKSINIYTVEKVKIESVSGTRKVECYNNVRKYIKMNGGEIQFGWTFSQLGNIVFKLTAHAVVKLHNGTLKCVTPPEHDISEINFSPDNTIKKLIVNERLPAKAYALVDKEVVKKFVDLENLQNKMRLAGNELAIAFIMHEKHLISKKIIDSFNSSLSSKQT